jgi:carotenoid cleavage dioxygenase-like enzyme
MKKRKNFFENILDHVGKVLKKLFRPESNLSKNSDEPKVIGLLNTSREEIDGTLTILEGSLPNDIHGVFYVSLPVGSVNSAGLPFPEKNPDGSKNKEFGSPIMNGDGLVIQVDLNTKPLPSVKTKLMKTPCYYADEATRYGTEHHDLLGFRNLGITRMSLALGARNELNTAVQPIRFKGQKHPSLLATYDVGRPFVLDPKTMEIHLPISKATQWMNAQPPMVPWPFGVVQTTAHPVFDPRTKELFSVNYSRSKSSFSQMEFTLHHMRKNKGLFLRLLEALAHEIVDHPDIHHVKSRLHAFLKELPSQLKTDHEVEHGKKHEVFMYLLRFDGIDSTTRWEVFDQNGEKLIIDECMHQMGITEDFIILTDCAFKFGLDLMFDNPFPESKIIERLIRRLTTVRMDPFTETYIIRRADLDPAQNKVTAYKLKEPIPYETIHYSCDYANPDGIVTLYGIHNAATCIAEWVRTFDIRATDGKPVDPEYYSLFAVGSMDVSRLGKWRINTKTLELEKDNSAVFESAGNYEEEKIGPNTWTMVLYTYRDIISAERNVPTIKQLWFVSAGADENLLTEFVWNLYKDYPHRKISLEEVKKITKKGVPVCLQRINLETMQPEDLFQFSNKVYCRGVHFIPRKTRDLQIPEELDGYLFCPVQKGYINEEGNWEFSSEFWVFDATDIAKGPICKMKHEGVKFAFTLHTAWLEEAVSETLPKPFTIKEDYGEVISKIPKMEGEKFLEPFFEQNIYPHFS